MELMAEGMSRWGASVKSANHFFKSILSATLAISITFFPFLLTTTGMYHDFLLLFPWGILIVLLVSLVVAELLTPFLQFYFIREPIKERMGKDGKPHFSFLNLIQKYYNNRLLFPPSVRCCWCSCCIGLSWYRTHGYPSSEDDAYCRT